MHWQYTLYIPLLFIAGAISAVLAIYAGKRIAAPGAAMFMLLMLALAVWSVGYALSLSNETLPAKLFWTQVQYAGVVIVPGAWLGFVLEYTGHSKWMTRRTLALLAVEPLVVLSLVWTNDVHRLMWTEASMEVRGGLAVLGLTPGIAFWVHTAYSYLLLLLGSVLLVHMLVQSSRVSQGLSLYRGQRVHRGQVVALLIGLLAPWVGNILSLSGLNSFPLDLTPLGFVIAGLAIAWGLLRFRLFDVVPMARNAVLRSMTDGVFVLDPRGHIVDLNLAAQRAIGRVASSVTGEPVEAVLPGYADAIESRRLPPGKESEGPLLAEIPLWVQPEDRQVALDAADPHRQVFRAGNVLRYFEIRVSPLYARRDRLSGRLVILRDITERYQQGMLYRVHRAVAGRLTPDSVVQMALESIVQNEGWSSAILALPGEDGTRWVVHAAQGAPQSVTASDLAGETGIVARVFGTGKTQFVPYVSARTDYVSLRPDVQSELAVPLRRGEDVIGVLAFTSERPAAFSVDDVRLAESLADAIALTMDNASLFQATVNERQRLLTLIESSRDGIVLVGLGKRMLVVNARALDFLGLPGQPKDWTERPVRDALDVLEDHVPSAAHAIWTEMARIEAGDEPAQEGEFEVFPRSIQWFNLPVLAEEQPLGRLLVFHDVTEERLLAKMREDLTHTMVHDLRNPLTGISTALQLLDNKLTTVITPAQHRLFEIANNSTRRMVDLVNSILDLSRLENGKMPLDPTAVSLPDLLAETLRLQSPLSAAKKLHLDTDIPPTLPLAWADAELLERVLQNLVGNAIKFTPVGGVITVSARYSVDESSPDDGHGAPPCPHMYVSVTDSGPGVPPEMRDKLFQKFVVGEQEERGSGLGLAFCKLAVEAHDGQIWVESGPGGGACFVFTLPIFDEDKVAESSIVG